MTNTPDKSEMKADERILPQAPLWNGVGKYGPALCMDNCTLHIMSRGFGAKDGDGYLTHNPNECEWDRDDESGKDYVVVPVSNSDLLFLRDKLNELFPSSRPPADQVPDMVERVARALQRENRPNNDCRNRDQRDADEDASIGAYRELAKAAIAALEVGWQPIESAPKDGTLVMLLVDYSGEDGDHWIDDSETGLGRTIGHNNDDNVGEGEGQGWQFAGWCWSHDHYVEGVGRPVKWRPLPEPPALKASGEK